MTRKAARRRVPGALDRMLAADERVERSGTTWAAELGGRVSVLFRARQLHQLVLTDQRLLLVRRPRRRQRLTADDVVLAKRYPTFHLERVRALRPMLQLRLRTAAERSLLLEFRPRERGLGRELAARLGGRRGRRSPLALPPGPVYEPPAPGPTWPDWPEPRLR